MQTTAPSDDQPNDCELFGCTGMDEADCCGLLWFVQVAESRGLGSVSRPLSGCLLQWSVHSADAHCYGSVDFSQLARYWRSSGQPLCLSGSCCFKAAPSPSLTSHTFLQASAFNSTLSEWNTGSHHGHEVLFHPFLIVPLDFLLVC